MHFGVVGSDRLRTVTPAASRERVNICWRMRVLSWILASDRQLFFELYVKTHTQTLTHDSHRPRGEVVDKTGTTAYSARSSEPIPPMDTPDTGGHTTHRDYASDNVSRWSVSGAPPKRCPSRFEDLGLATFPQRGVPAHWARQGVASSCAFSHGLWDEAAPL